MPLLHSDKSGMTRTYDAVPIEPLIPGPGFSHHYGMPDLCQRDA